MRCELVCGGGFLIGVTVVGVLLLGGGIGVGLLLLYGGNVMLVYC